MADPTPLISLTLQTGKDALKTLNKALDSVETAKTWYGDDCYEDFVRKGGWRWIGRFFRGQISKTPAIKKVFTVQQEDWLMIIREALPVAHTWFREKKESDCECSWVSLYRAYKESRGKFGNKNEHLLAKAELAFSSLGIVQSRPAARLDLWGLVVMAYANGAWSQVISGNDGGFRVNLLAKNFVLNISQANINSQAVAFLEPRQHPDEGTEPLGADDTRYLFINGQSVSTEDVSLGWPLNADPKTQPPLDLVHGRMDKQLKKVVLDYFRAHDLRKRLRHAIIDYRKKWAVFVQIGASSTSF